MKWDRIRIWLVTGLKIALFSAAAVFLFTRIWGSRQSSAPFESVSAAVTGAADLTPMDPGDNQMLRRLYGLDPESWPQYTLYCPGSNMNVEELLVMKVPEGGDAEFLRAALEDRVASQIASFEGYGPDQVAMLERARIEVQGGYALLVVAEDPEPVRRAFLAAL